MSREAPVPALSHRPEGAMLFSDQDVPNPRNKSPFKTGDQRNTLVCVQSTPPAESTPCHFVLTARDDFPSSTTTTRRGPVD
jgi:hypothetical protein